MAIVPPKESLIKWIVIENWQRKKQSQKFNFLEARTPGKYIFETKDLIIGYDALSFRPLNLTMERGQKAVLVGANGIGKTTLFKEYPGTDTCFKRCSVELGSIICPSDILKQEMAPGNTTTWSG